MESDSEEISFELLFDKDKYRALAVFLFYANSVIEGLNPDEFSVNIDDRQALRFVNCLEDGNEFPANGGFESASPFKKAASIFVYLIAENPFQSKVSFENLQLPPHEVAAIVGFGIVKDCLSGAEFVDKNGRRVVLENPIRISHHFFKDLLEASRGITAMTHFKTYSILFESLAYQANPNAQYPDRI